MMEWVLILLATTLLIFFVSCMFVKKEPMRDMKSKFESGVDQSEQEWPPFYIHFFNVGILFLIFDVEIVLSIPMITSVMTSEKGNLFWNLFIIIISIGLMVELLTNSIEWKE